mmetsp:Transcript_53798/g.131502  ORF Transcript_53798/g.131502 Transcript_53798/m.131502 type:complete len:221 (-) Transcript_53798:329-991(-)
MGLRPRLCCLGVLVGELQRAEDRRVDEGLRGVHRCDVGLDAVHEEGHKEVFDLFDEGVVEEARALQTPEYLRQHVPDVAVREAARRHLLGHGLLVLDAPALLQDPALLLIMPPLLCSLHALCLCELRAADVVELVLVRPHVGQLLLLEDLHERLLQRLAHHDLQDRLHLEVEVEQVPLKDLRLAVHPRLHWEEQRRGRAVHEGVRLRLHLELHRPVGDLL